MVTHIIEAMKENIDDRLNSCGGILFIGETITIRFVCVGHYREPTPPQ